MTLINALDMLNYALALASQIAEFSDNQSSNKTGETQSDSNRDDSSTRIDLISTDKL